MERFSPADRHRLPPNALDHLPDADFRVSCSTPHGWKVEMLTPRARLWARTNLSCDQFDTAEPVFSTDLAGANSLIHRARLSGLVSEYAGPLAAVRI